MNTGPLAGIRVIELAGIGPGPFAGMLLADLGAEVLRVDRAVPAGLMLGAGGRADVVNRGKRSIAVDLKQPAGRDLVLKLVEGSDVLIEGYRPGVAERLGLGPDDCADRNPRLVYGRMTGWGQEGPLSSVAGHDIGYIALSGALWATGRADEKPVAPLNIIGDYAGGSMFLIVGVLAALLEAKSSGRGQVIDAAMIDGASVLTTTFTALANMGAWDLSNRGTNALDSGAPWYDVFACADGKWIAVGALEPQFYKQMVELTRFREGASDLDRFWQSGPETWPALKAEWTAHWLTRTRDDWTDLLGSTDSCVQPVLDWDERLKHQHNVDRGVFVELDGITQPAPAPRLSRTPAGVQRRPPLPGEHTRELAREAGLTDEAVQALLATGAVTEVQSVL